jgi:chorismate synthase
VARALLASVEIDVWSHTVEVGGVAMNTDRAMRTREEAEASPLRCPDPEAETRMVARIDEAREAGDTVGGVFEVATRGVPMGLGSHVHWDRRLDAALAGAIVSIPIVKGVEFGLGFAQTRLFGSAVQDVIERRDADGGWVRGTNNAGGLEGGISNGEPIVIRGAVKPISTLPRPLPSADLVTGEPVEKAHYERSDISVVPATGVVAEAMVCLTLADFVLDKFGGDSLAETLDNVARYRARIARRSFVRPGGGASAAGAGPSSGVPSTSKTSGAAPAESE